MFQLFLICNRLVSDKTIEENILKKANEKRLLGSVAIEGGNFTTAFFRQVLREYLNLLNLRLISVQAWKCRLMEVGLYNGRKVVVVVVLFSSSQLFVARMLLVW